MFPTLEPQLARYREANRNLAAPKAGESRIVFMGDSITDIWQQDRFGFFVPAKPYVDRGISGQTDRHRGQRDRYKLFHPASAPRKVLEATAFRYGRSCGRACKGVPAAAITTPGPLIEQDCREKRHREPLGSRCSLGRVSLRSDPGVALDIG